MQLSVFDLFSPGIGPSSSHTVGPMKAANQFIHQLLIQEKLIPTKKIRVELFGSLAFTGKGHGSDRAILLGLENQLPEEVAPDYVAARALEIMATKTLLLGNRHAIHFNEATDLIFNRKDLLPAHTNGMRFSAHDAGNKQLLSEIYYSIGGGFILNECQSSHSALQNSPDFPFPFANAKTLLATCEQQHFSIRDLMFVNESTLRHADEVKTGLLHIFSIMKNSIEKGCHHDGILPGGLNVKRRAPELYRKLMNEKKNTLHQQVDTMAWLNLFAIAVNEENAAGGRIVTAPTNGAAGIIPAVLHYFLTFYANHAPEEIIVTFLLTAGAIGILYKKGASISGAEAGCQGEVGVACSMAAAALTAVLGGSLNQIENAAEIAMEHHLGMTCDPVKGLVQIPCIERNAMGAVKAVNAARLALLGDGLHHISLDKVIATMKQTGEDMLSIYKETSLGGLAANLPEC